MSELIKKQNFGIEIELTGITRENASKVIAEYYGTTHYYIGNGCYKIWGANDTQGRIWRCERDSSIKPQRVKGGEVNSSYDDYRCEVVSPILQYSDIEDLQNIVRQLSAHGAFANSSTGIHVHVDAERHTAESLTRLMNIFVGRQDLFYEALQIGHRANEWCCKMNVELLTEMKKASTRSDIERIWYSSSNICRGGYHYRGGINHEHYNETRYHGLNFHATFTKGTVEFRLFNGTTHAGKIKAYIQFCLALSAWAIECENTNLFFKSTANMTMAQKSKIMNSFLKGRLGLTGNEFKTCRLHLTSAFNEDQDLALAG